MSSNKGYPSKHKASQSKVDYVTVSPLGVAQHGQDIIAHNTVFNAANDAIDAFGADNKTITAAGHAVRPGDLIRFTSGLANGMEVRVESVTDANNFVLAIPFVNEIAGFRPAAADTFDILRDVTLTVDVTGGITSVPVAGPVQFVRDGANQNVIEDTGTPANNRPLPVKLTGIDGDVTINAPNVNLAVQLDHNSANPDSIQIGDGVDVLGIYPEDSAHVNGDTGLQVLAVRNDANTSLVGTDGDYAPVQVDATGLLKVNVVAGGGGGTQFAEDAAHGSGDLGTQALAVRNDANSSLVDTDGDYSPLQVDATGLLKVNVIAGGGGGTQFAEDAAHTTGDLGTQALAVRNDANSSLVGTDGDYSPLQVDATGLLKVNVVAGASSGAQFAEDAAHGSGDLGTQALAVRNDANSSLVDTDGDYSPLQVDSTGLLKVNVISGGSTQFAEDAAHTTGDLGTQALAVRNDANSSLVGTDGDYSPLQVDATGLLKVNVVSGSGAGTEFAEDSGHTTGDLGTQMLAVRQDANASLVGTDLDYAPLQVDSTGNLKVNVVSGVTAGTEFAEDSAHASGHLGTQILAVRQDALASSTDTDGDYASLKSNAAGSLYVNQSEALPAGTNNIGDVDVLTMPATFAEDSGHVSGDTGVQMLAVRQDANASLVGTDLDYAPLQVNATGSLKVEVTAGGGGGAQFAEDSAHGSGDLGTQVLAVRNDAGTSLVGTDGDYAPLQVDSTGALRVTSGGGGGGGTPLSFLTEVDKIDVPGGPGFTTPGGVSTDSLNASGVNMIASTAAIIRRIDVVWSFQDEASTDPTDKDQTIMVYTGAGNLPAYETSGWQFTFPIFRQTSGATGFSVSSPQKLSFDVNIPAGTRIAIAFNAASGPGAIMYFRFLGEA